jgi:nitrate reductase gamma subunit
LWALLTPHSVQEHFMAGQQKQMLAVIAGGIAGLICFSGLSLLLDWRLFDPRIQRRGTDCVVQVFQLHMVMGMTPFLLAPVACLVRVFSATVW